MSSSDEEQLDPFYVDYQRRLEGLPPQQYGVKGRQRAFDYLETEVAMEWEATNERGSTAPQNTSNSQKEDEDRDTVIYSDPDDRTPTPPARHSNPRDRSFGYQNTKFSEPHFRTPLRNLNTRGRGRVFNSSARGRGRHFGPSRSSLHRQSRHNRNVYIPPDQKLPHSQPGFSRGRSPRRPTPTLDIPPVPEPWNDEPFQRPPPAQTFVRPLPTVRPPERIRLADNSHLAAPKREDLKWSNRRYEKTSRNRKSKGVAFVDTFGGSLAPHRALRFGPQRRSMEEAHSSEEGNDSKEEGVPEDVTEDTADEAITVDEVIPTSPQPYLPLRQLSQARKQLIEISDDSEPESVVNLDNSGSETESSSNPDVEGYEPEPARELLPLEPMVMPPQPIVEALRRAVSISSSPTLPFLRRNLKQSFYHRFFNHISRKERSIPKVPSYQSEQPSVRWEYWATPSADPWPALRLGWSCQLCDFFPPFTLGSALMYHLRRDHSSVVARRKKTGFRRWVIVVDLFRHVPRASIWVRETSTHASGPSPIAHPIELSRDTVSLDDGDQVEDAVEQLTSAIMDLATDGEIRSYRVGGTGCYDLAMQEMAMPLKGLAAKTLEARENDLCFYPKCSDKEKSMAIIWGRWISQRRIEFVRDPLKNAMTFIDQHWDIIRRTAEQEGLIRWLLVYYEVPSLLHTEPGRSALQAISASFALNAHEAETRNVDIGRLKETWRCPTSTPR